MNDHGFIILHGIGGSPPGHWQHWLATELKSRGHLVHFPARRKTLIAHSLGALLWLNYAGRANAIPVERVLLVAPPDVDFIRASGRVAAFPTGKPFPIPSHLRPREAVLACSESDPYCPGGAHRHWDESWHLKPVIFPSEAGHINLDSGFGPWPFALDWALAALPPAKRPTSSVNGTSLHP